MKSRSDWKWPDWVARYVCALSGLALLVVAARSFYEQHFRFVPLLIAAAIILEGLSWAPQLLLSPKLPAAKSWFEPMEVPRITAFMLAHGSYWLIFGLIVACLLSN